MGQRVKEISLQSTCVLFMRYNSYVQREGQVINQKKIIFCRSIRWLFTLLFIFPFITLSKPEDLQMLKAYHLAQGQSLKGKFSVVFNYIPKGIRRKYHIFSSVSR